MIECLVTLFLLPGCALPLPYHPPAEIIVPLPRPRPVDAGHVNPVHRDPQEEQHYTRPPLCPWKTCYA
jgi:hypothetical protein